LTNIGGWRSSATQNEKRRINVGERKVKRFEKSVTLEIYYEWDRTTPNKIMLEVLKTDGVRGVERKKLCVEDKEKHE